jgi:phosphate transport system permease protein
LFRLPADQLLQRTLFVVSLLTASLVGLIILFVLRETLPALQGPGLARFVTDESWHPLEGKFGMLPMLWGTLFSTTLAVLLATPLGVGMAIFCRYVAPPALVPMFRGLTSLLAGIPSVVFGFWGLTVLVPLIARVEPPGASLLAASLILAIMILPTVALMSEAALAAVPVSYAHGAEALGLGRRATVLRVLIPAAKSGIIAAVILATARALGETMAVLMVSGNVVETPTSLFAPIRTLTANIALEMAYATKFHRASLFVSGLVLTVVIMALALLAYRAEHSAHNATGASRAA